MSELFLEVVLTPYKIKYDNNTKDVSAFRKRIPLKQKMT